MQPEIHLGSITLQTFGIAFACAFIAAGAVLARRFRELGRSPDWAYEVILFALIGGLVGARLDFVLENYDSVKNDLLGNIFSGSGLVWYGGAIGGAAGVCLWAWWRGMLNLVLLDACAVPLSVGYAIGRIGCQVSGDGDYVAVQAVNEMNDMLQPLLGHPGTEMDIAYLGDGEAVEGG